MKTIARIASGAAFLLLNPCFGQTAGSVQAWPNKPIRFIANTAPGGPQDILSRLIGQKLTEFLGQPVIVENRSGAGGNIGTVAVANSEPDGYTALMSSTAFVANVSLYPQPGYDAERDFIPLAVIARQPTLILVNANSPARNLIELLRLAKDSKLAFATPGSGTRTRIAQISLSLKGVF
jgi:tripartite-type tricarboxylate transporter receptor subunit TctC